MIIWLCSELLPVTGRRCQLVVEGLHLDDMYSFRYYYRVTKKEDEIEEEVKIAGQKREEVLQK
jgi:hypothetical protein